MKTRFSQQGLSMTGWMAVLFVVATYVICAVKILPLYLDAWTARTALESVVEKQQLKPGSIIDVRRSIDRQFSANRVEVLKAKKIKIAKKNGKIIIDATYERREPLFYNIDVVVKFDKMIFEITPNNLSQ